MFSTLAERGRFPLPTRESRNRFLGDRAKAKRTIREVHQRGMADYATPQLLRGAEKDRLHHSFNLRGHLLSGDAIAGLKPATRGSEDGPGSRGRQQC